MIWGPYNQRIDQLSHSASAADRKASSQEEELIRMEQHLNRLTLACQSMWELIRDKTELTEDDLRERILEVDLRDGYADGKMAPTVLVCQACGRNSSSKHSYCVMCGAPMEKPSQFDG